MILTCSQCGQKNRIGAGALAAQSRCGQCKAPLGPLSWPLDADSALFDAILQEARVPVLVDFWAAWCGPCRMAAPEVKRTAEIMAGRAVVLKVDTERHPELAARYRVSSIPNFLVLKDGRVFSQQAGAVRHAEMARWLEAAGA
ncbi:MAG: thioredoxin fold domain-containing protein [Acidobacteria bacterium]|nr:thioredoxin fold domain-containing protein [Acidobacteriota bacterium]